MLGHVLGCRASGCMTFYTGKFTMADREHAPTAFVLLLRGPSLAPWAVATASTKSWFAVGLSVVTIDVYAARSPLARHEARYFGPA
jgi:hypothetical protein